MEVVGRAGRLDRWVKPLVDGWADARGRSVRGALPKRWVAFVGALLALGLTARGAQAFQFEGLEVLWGFDMDQVSVPMFTEDNFISVTTLTRPDTPPFTEVSAGYAFDERPPTDERILPLEDTDAPTDLWADFHNVLTFPFATLQLTGIPEGDYTLYLLSHDPGSSGLRATNFSVDTDGDPSNDQTGTVQNDPNSTDLMAEQTLILPIQVNDGGVIEITYTTGSVFGWAYLNGVLIVPEPAFLPLLAVGTMLWVAVRRQ